MPREFIFVFIRYFTGWYCRESLPKGGGFGKKYKKEGWSYRGVVYWRGGSNLLHIMLKRGALRKNCSETRRSMIETGRFYIWFYLLYGFMILYPFAPEKTSLMQPRSFFPEFSLWLLLDTIDTSVSSFLISLFFSTSTQN